MAQAAEKRRESPLLPMSDTRESALFFVIAALCFLAVLTAFSVRATYSAAEGWTANVEGELTARLSGSDAARMEEALGLIRSVDRVQTAKALTRAEAEALLQPWFGTQSLPDSLPLPSLIAITTEPGTQNIGPDIKRALAEIGLEAEIDDHAKWAENIRDMLTLIRLIAMGIVALLASIAIAVIAFATHAALLARREIVDVLHITGAEDQFIAKLFERRFSLLGFQAGLLGALLALGFAISLAFFAGRMTDWVWLLPSIALDRWALMIMLVSALLAGLVARGAARLTVTLALGRMS